MRAAARCAAARCAAALLLAVTAAVGVALASVPAAAATTTGTGPPDLELLGQTPYVVASGTFRLDVSVTAPDSSDVLYVAAYSRLHTRSDFDQAVAGQPNGYQLWAEATHLSALTAAAGGGVAIDIPVDRPGDPSTGSYTFNARNGPAVYPLVVQLYSGSRVPIGKPLTTFMVYSPQAPSGLQRLAVSLTLAVDGPVDPGPTVTAIPGGAAPSLRALVAVLAAHRSVPVTLSAVPELLDRLAAGSAADRALLATLAAGSGADQVLPAPYYPTDVGSLWASGMSGELQLQYAAGAAALSADLHQAPDAGAASEPGGVDASELSGLASTGVSHLVVPDGVLSPLPSSDRQITFASPTPLDGPKGTAPTSVFATDPELSGYLVPAARSRTASVLSAERLLAGLALVQLEAPSERRGVALQAPAGTTADPTVLATVLGGLSGNPLLSAVTVDGLFRTVAPSSPPVARSLADTRTAPPVEEGASLSAARTALGGLAGILPTEGRIVAPAERQLLFAGSSLATADGRSALLARVRAAVKKAEAGISLPGSSSITLTARTGTIPLTLLSNPSLHAHVQLQIFSAKLTFRPLTTALGTCAVSYSATETCQLVLTSEATTLRVPVESRTGGVFSLQVTLSSPDGSVVLATNRDTVRSTAFSGVGVVLIVAAALGLAVWWVRNARHGRRARQLVDRPGDVIRLPALDPPPEPAGGHIGNGQSTNGHTVAAEGAALADVGDPGVAGEAATPWLDADPVISEFFSSPAPEYGDRSADGAQVSPIGGRRGPNSRGPNTQTH